MNPREALTCREYQHARIGRCNERLGFVYCIAEDGEREWTKVGWAIDPAKRLRTLQTGNPRRLTLLAASPGTLSDERWAHGQLHGVRARSEWFAGLSQPSLQELARREAFAGFKRYPSIGELVEAAVYAQN